MVPNKGNPKQWFNAFSNGAMLVYGDPIVRAFDVAGMNLHTRLQEMSLDLSMQEKLVQLMRLYLIF